jgi:hypothetical protein
MLFLILQNFLCKNIRINESFLVHVFFHRTYCKFPWILSKRQWRRSCVYVCGNKRGKDRPQQ